MMSCTNVKKKTIKADVLICNQPNINVKHAKDIYNSTKSLLLSQSAVIWSDAAQFSQEEELLRE